MYDEKDATEVTEKEVQALKEQIESAHPNTKVVPVPGDIAQRETSLKVDVRTYSVSLPPAEHAKRRSLKRA